MENSYLIEKYRNELNKNVIIINADSFRKYHPRFKEIENDSLIEIAMILVLIQAQERVFGVAK